MRYEGGGIGWGGWFAMVVMMVVFWGAIAWVVVTLIRRNGSNASSVAPRGPATSDARQILDERFARGEIDEAEYQRRRDVLGGGT
jgi:putative membrane protein